MATKLQASTANLFQEMPPRELIKNRLFFPAYLTELQKNLSKNKRKEAMKVVAFCFSYYILLLYGVST